MEKTERELSKMSVQELREYCDKLQARITTAEWYLRQKQISSAKFPKIPEKKD
jgi:hypothetical protein